MPIIGLFEKQVPYEHHHEINRGKNKEHKPDSVFAKAFEHPFHNGAGDSLCSAEACNSKTRRKSLLLLKPKHERLYRGKITGTKTDTHNKTVAHINADKRDYAAFMHTAVPDKRTCTCHTEGEAYRRDKGGFMYILFYNISEECRRHTQKEDGKAECPFSCALGLTDIIGNFLTEHRPAINRTDTAMKQKRRNRRANPFIGAPTAACFDVCTHIKVSFR